MITVKVKLPGRKKQKQTDLRAVAGASSQAAQSLAAEYPEYELWTVTKNLGTGKFDCLNTIGQPRSNVRALDARARKYLKPGMTVLVGFENRDPERPFIFGIYGMGGEFDPNPVVLEPWGWDRRESNYASCHPSSSMEIVRQVQMWTGYGASGGLGFDGPVKRLDHRGQAIAWDYALDLADIIGGGGAQWNRPNGLMRLVAHIGEPDTFSFDTVFGEELILDITIEGGAYWILTRKDLHYVGSKIRSTYTLSVSGVDFFDEDLTRFELCVTGWNPDTETNDNVAKPPDDFRGIARLGFFDRKVWIPANMLGSDYLYLESFTRWLQHQKVIEFDVDDHSVVEIDIGEFEDLQDGATDPDNILGWYNVSDDTVGQQILVGYGIKKKLIAMDAREQSILWTLGSADDLVQLRYEPILQIGNRLLCYKIEDIYESYETVIRPNPADIAAMHEDTIEEQVAWVLETFNVPTTAYYYAGTRRSYVLIDNKGTEVASRAIPTTPILLGTTTYNVGAHLYQMTPSDTDHDRIVQSWWQAHEYRKNQKLFDGTERVDPNTGDYYRQLQVSGGFQIPNPWAAPDGPPQGAGLEILHNPGGLSSGYGGLIPFGFNPVNETGDGGGATPTQLHDRIDYGGWVAPVDYPQKRYPLSPDTLAEYPIDGDAAISFLILEGRYISSATIGYDPGEEQIVYHYAFADSTKVWAAKNDPDNAKKRLVSVTTDEAQCTVTLYDSGLAKLWEKKIAFKAPARNNAVRVIIAGSTVALFFAFGTPGSVRFVQMKLSSGVVIQDQILTGIGFLATDIHYLPEVAFDGQTLTIGDTAFLIKQ